MAILFDGRFSGNGNWAYDAASDRWMNGTDQYALDRENSRAAIDAMQFVVDREYGRVMRCRLTPDDVVSGEQKARIELSAPSGGIGDAGPPRDTSDQFMAKGVDLWFAGAFQLSAGTVFGRASTPDRGDVVLVQWHDKPGGSRKAPAHIVLINDELQFRNSYDTGSGYDRLMWRAKARKGVWYRWVLQALWDDSAPGAGYMRLWINDQKVFEETSALNTYSDDNDPGPWPKMGGLYVPHGWPAGVPSLEVKHIGLIVGTEYAGYAEFSAAAALGWSEAEAVLPGQMAIC